MQVQYSIIILFPSKHREELKHQACAHQHFSPTAQQTHHKGDTCDWQRKNYIKLIVHFTLLDGTQPHFCTGYQNTTHAILHKRSIISDIPPLPY